MGYYIAPRTMDFYPISQLRGKGHISSNLFSIIFRHSSPTFRGGESSASELINNELALLHDDRDFDIMAEHLSELNILNSF